MNKQNQKLNWLLDFGLFAGFLVSFFLDLTGIVIHQWLGVAVFLLILVHLILHQNWVVTVTNNFFLKVPLRTRLYAFLDGLIFLGFFMIVFTGLIMSTWFNLYLTNYDAWYTLHLYCSIGTLVLTVIKIGMHWRWIVKTAGKFFRGTNPVQPQPQLVSHGIEKMVSRRQFMTTMGVVGLGSVLAISTVLSKLQAYESTVSAQSVEPTATQNSVAISQPTATQQSLATSEPTATTASVQQVLPTATAQPTVQTMQTVQVCSYSCRRGQHCAYPGQCHDYRDSNGNGLCDKGECA